MKEKHNFWRNGGKNVVDAKNNKKIVSNLEILRVDFDNSLPLQKNMFD
jgi:hypothetical protein